jgi:hypothetical protein
MLFSIGFILGKQKENNFKKLFIILIGHPAAQRYLSLPIKGE